MFGEAGANLKPVRVAARCRWDAAVSKRRERGFRNLVVPFKLGPPMIPDAMAFAAIEIG